MEKINDKIKKNDVKNLINISDNFNEKILKNNNENLSKTDDKKSKKINAKIDNKNSKNIKKKKDKKTTQICAKNKVKNVEKKYIKNDNKMDYEFISFFNDGKVDLTNIVNKKKFLNLFASGLYSLSHSKVYNGKLGIGGEYHKNYYSYLKQGFNKTKNEFFYLKNCDFNEFSLKIKLNLCNYGIYFYKENGRDYLVVLSGNSFVLAKSQQNFLEKFIKNRYNTND